MLLSNILTTPKTVEKYLLNQNVKQLKHLKAPSNKNIKTINVENLYIHH
jgi:hypothetical protein